MEYVIRFAQQHVTFRRPEIEALATFYGVDIEFVFYDDYSPFCVVRFPDNDAARAVVSRSVLAQDLYELWGQGSSYEELHADVRRRTQHRWSEFRDVSFRFDVSTFAYKRSREEKVDIIQSFEYLDFRGPIRMTGYDELFGVLEEHEWDCEEVDREQYRLPPRGREAIKTIYFGRWLTSSSRNLIDRYDLKKRRYISTTSMDAELALVTANMGLVGPGKLVYDPFVGTGSFLVAAAHFGAMTMGSDIDGRSFRGRNHDRTKQLGIYTNFVQYGTTSRYVDAFTADLTNTPIREEPFLDAILCDPPYGIREGLKVLGSRDDKPKVPIYIDGVPAYRLPGYVAPKRPYGFMAILNDILEFASRTLVENGRLCMWMPTANDQDVELMIPTHPSMEIMAVSVQQFGNWSRRLLTYRKLRKGEISADSKVPRREDSEGGVTADDLNEFRRKYFAPRESRHGNQPRNNTSSSSQTEATTTTTPEPPTSDMASMKVTDDKEERHDTK